MKLLIVDDEKPILAAMSAYFKTKKYDVDCASEREEAEALLAHYRYSCIIVDLKLTPLSNAEGLDIVRLCRDCSPATRIIVLTAYGTPDIEAEAVARGADAFQRKPQPLGELAQLVEALIGARSVTPVLPWTGCL